MAYTPLFEVNFDAVCDKCGHKGAVKFFGDWRDTGDKDTRMNYAVGFGGTIPYRCTNCGNIGMIDSDGLEGYKKAFTIPKCPRRQNEEFSPGEKFCRICGLEII